MTQTESMPLRLLPSRHPRYSAPAEPSPADAASVGVLRLNKQGDITYVNGCWRALLEGSQLHALGRVELGMSLASVCNAAASSAWGQELATAIRAMTSGDSESFELAYSAHSISKLRWLRLQARWHSGRSSIALTCVDCTDYRIALARSRIHGCVAETFATSTRLLAACRHLGVIVASELEWDYAAVWVPDPTSLKLRCHDLWTRPLTALHGHGCDDAALQAELAQGEGLPGRAWRSLHAEWVVRDDDAPEREGVLGSAPDAGFRSGLAFAVRHEDETLAVIELLGRMAQRPDPSIAALLEMAGARLATAELRARADSVSEQPDISQIKRAQHELFEAQRMAALGTMAAGIAHEINTPVQFVGDSLEFLRDATHDTGRLISAFQELRNAVESRSTQDQVDELVRIANHAEEQADLEYLQERVPRAFDRCADGLNRVTSIVRSMKEFSHPAHKEMAPADLNRAITATLTVARNEYKYVADLVTDLGDLPLVRCHVNEINQVVLNIVVNAAHAIGDLVQGSLRKGTITVRTSLQGELAQIAISDTGGGIPEHVRGRIFEPFFTTKEVGRGTGQGLALAWRAIKERHGGELCFESTVGSGTTFYIRLPVAGRGDLKEAT